LISVRNNNIMITDRVLVLSLLDTMEDHPRHKDEATTLTRVSVLPTHPDLRPRRIHQAELRHHTAGHLPHPAPVALGAPPTTAPHHHSPEAPEVMAHHRRMHRLGAQVSVTKSRLDRHKKFLYHFCVFFLSCSYPYGNALNLERPQL
jgi:hypothetical protein